MKITQKILQNIIKEEVQKILNEKTPEASAAMNQMYQQNLLNTPEVKALKPKLDAIDGVDKVFVDGIKDSSKPGFKLIKVEFRVPAEG